MALVLPHLVLAKDYLAWLKGRFRTVQQGDVSVLVTPFLDPFHDGIQIYIEHRNGEYLLHDNGDTIDNLKSLGVEVNSSRRQALIRRALEGCNVRFANERLEIVASEQNLPQRVHFLLTASLRLNDLWMSQTHRTPRTPEDFFELVREFLDQREIRYKANVRIRGKTERHHIDFVIPSQQRAERLVKLMRRPSSQSAKDVLFMRMDLQESFTGAQWAVIINDTLNDTPPGTLLENGDVENGQEEVSIPIKISDQVATIIQHYCPEIEICYWSRHHTKDFTRFLSSNGQM